MSLDQIALALGIVTAGGGITGYVRTGSIPSVAAGVTVGALYILASYRLKSKLPYALETGLAASVILAGASIPRAIKTGKPLPIGLSVLATIGLLSFGMAFQKKAV